MEAVEKKKMMRSLNDRQFLYEDIIINILSKLPVKSLLRFRCVCKRWLYLISEYQSFYQITAKSKAPSLLFIDKNKLSDPIVASSIDMEKNPISRFEVKVEHYYPNLLPTRFDLVCFYSYREIFICNPSTHEIITLPLLPPEDGLDGYSTASVGFGYVESTDEYKVVRLTSTAATRFENDSVTSKCRVFTLGGSTSSSSSWAWRDLMNSPYEVCCEEPPAFVNGSLHWLPYFYGEFEPENTIVAFDVKSEEFRLLPLPKGFPDLISLPGGADIKLMELKGLLCVSYRENLKLGMWMLKDYESRTWMKEYSIDLNVVVNSCLYGWNYEPSFTPRDIDDTKVLIEITGTGTLGYYHFQSKRFNKFIEFKHLGGRLQFSFYVESLRSLKQLQGKASIEAEAKSERHSL